MNKYFFVMLIFATGAVYGSEESKEKSASGSATSAVLPEKMGPKEQLIVAVKACNASEVKGLLEAKVHPEFKLKGRNTPLQYAAGEGATEICTLLLNAGADAGNIGRDSCYPFVYYCQAKKKNDPNWQSDDVSKRLDIIT
jgi:hypothetical protein